MTYWELDLVVMVIAAVAVVLAVRAARPSRSWWWVVAVVVAGLSLLTAVFDSLMIAADLFRYGAGTLTGARVWLTPIEDFAWPVVAAVLLPALWEALGSRRRSQA